MYNCADKSIVVLLFPLEGYMMCRIIRVGIDHATLEDTSFIVHIMPIQSRRQSY